MNSYSITQKQYNYLLPVFGLAAQGTTKIFERYHSARKRSYYYFIGMPTDYVDMLNRCKYL